MTELPEIEHFLTSIEDNPDMTGSASEEFDGGDIKFQVSIGMDSVENHRSGTISVLTKTDKTLEEISKDGAHRVSDIDEKYEDVEKTFSSLITQCLGYNAYEPMFDKADRPGEEEYDIVAHDSVVVFD
jgi:DNA integrity scanning protein DisA with diadenylate cyclase activity